MQEYYHYTLERNIRSIMASGMFKNGYLYTTEEYYDAFIAGQKLGVMPDNIDCVLKFRYVPGFRSGGLVDSSNRFTGGAPQFSHPMRLKPTHFRKIGQKVWRKL